MDRAILLRIFDKTRISKKAFDMLCNISKSHSLLNTKTIMRAPVKR